MNNLHKIYSDKDSMWNIVEKHILGDFQLTAARSEENWDR